MRAGKFLIGCSVAAALVSINAAQADVVISKKPTANMSCAAGVCTPTASKAVLNASDLANMLASGDVKVTTGSGATNIVVKDSFSWTSTSRLTLDAIQSVEFDKPVTVAGTGAVTITTNDGGSGGDLLFGDKGDLTFWDTSSSLVIGGNSYTLVKDIATLASDIAANPSGFYALANDYDASVDGTYTSAPVSSGFNNIVEGLNHKMDHVSVNTNNYFAAVFAGTDGGTLRDVQATNAVIQASGGNGGILMGSASHATVIGCSASGTLTVTSTDSYAGGLIGNGDGTIDRSHARAKISIASGGQAGGLVGSSAFRISRSYASGRVQAGDNASVGGLVGYQPFYGNIELSYALAKITAGENGNVGGLVGVQGGPVKNAYAMGAVNGGTTGSVGGFAGETGEASLYYSYSTGHVKGQIAGGFLGSARGGSFFADYWDVSTSGKTRGHGCGGGRCPQGIKGRKTEVFLSGLPPGFDPGIWGQKKTINGGFPYLLQNPPPK